jgi:hypothetical protein
LFVYLQVIDPRNDDTAKCNYIIARSPSRKNAALSGIRRKLKAGSQNPNNVWFMQQGSNLYHSVERKTCRPMTRSRQVEKEQPFWPLILQKKPDAWIWMGDNIYADVKRPLSSLPSALSEAFNSDLG